jgi:integrase
MDNEMKEGQSISSLKSIRLVIRRLDDFIKGKFSLIASKDYSLPDCFSKDFNAFIEYLRLEGKHESTIKSRYLNCLKFLKDFHTAGINSLSEIIPKDIYHVFSKSSDKVGLSVTLRSFLRYLFKSGTQKNDLSVFVPSVRQRQPIPSVYTKAETNKLLSSIDTEKHSGKRDYAIILLALLLGIRSGDITALKVSDIDFDSEVIEFSQNKTGAPQRLAFLPELKDAIRDYLSGSRPSTHYPNLFISATAPLRPVTALAVSNLITRHMNKAGIVKEGRKCGGHALRMTLASELVSEKVPYDVVRRILGHEDTTSMKHYVKFDIEMLRSCVLEVPPVSGLCAAYINKRKGGK